MKNKLKQGAKDFALLIRAYSLFHVPEEYCSPAERIPQALRLFPLWGAVSGGVLWAAAWVLYPGFFRLSALILLALDLFLGGACVLQQLMLFVDGRLLPSEKKKATLSRSPFAMLFALLWLLLLYSGYLYFLRSDSAEHLFSAQVYSRWFFCFSLRFLAVSRELPHKEGFSRSSFLFATLTAVLCLLPVSSGPLLFSIALSGLMVLLLWGVKRKMPGSSREKFSAASAAVLQVLFLWSLLCFGMGF